MMGMFHSDVTMMSDDSINEINFMIAGSEVTADAKPDQQVQVSVKGPEPGYIATPIIMVQAALTLQQERERCKSLMGSGGVFTPGALFGETSLIQRLNQAGVTFQVTDRQTKKG